MKQKSRNHYPIVSLEKDPLQIKCTGSQLVFSQPVFLPVSQSYYFDQSIFQTCHSSKKADRLVNHSVKTPFSLSLIHYSTDSCLLHPYEQSYPKQGSAPVNQPFSCQQISRLKSYHTYKLSIYPFKLPACQEVRSASQPVNPGGPRVVLISLVSAEKLNLQMMDEPSC